MELESFTRIFLYCFTNARFWPVVLLQQFSARVLV